jgi:hypothetical protein
VLAAAPGVSGQSGLGGHCRYLLAPPASHLPHLPFLLFPTIRFTQPSHNTSSSSFNQLEGVDKTSKKTSTSFSDVIWYWVDLHCHHAVVAVTAVVWPDTNSSVETEGGA